MAASHAAEMAAAWAREAAAWVHGAAARAHEAAAWASPIEPHHLDAAEGALELPAPTGGLDLGGETRLEGLQGDAARLECIGQ